MVARNAEGKSVLFFFLNQNLFPSTIEIRECLWKVLILHRDEF